MIAPGSGGQELLRAATVALEIPGEAASTPARATGFFAAPGIVATCAHALGDTRAALPDQVAGYLMDGQAIVLETVPEWYLRAEPGGLDVAFLRAVDAPEVPHVLLSGALDLRDPMWAYGHPAGKFRAGQSALFRYQGPSRLRPADGQWEPHRLFGTPVSGGYSGSPVLNLRTGAVCGMLCTSDEAGSAHMVTADDIIAGCPPVRAAQSTPAQNVRWLRLLRDEQLADGGWRFPGPRLRAYLDAAVRAAEDHPYPGVIPGVTPPPLTAVYVRQQAEAVTPDNADSPERSVFDLSTRPAEEILDRDEDCILIGGPGAGKSSLLRIALVTLARRWQHGEPGTEVPVHVLAADLIPPRPLPELIAASVTANLSAVGILNSWPPEFFGESPLRAVRWLVFVDGLDEVLDPAARRRVLDKIAGAGRAEEQDAPYRFIVATRPLADEEFPAPDAWRAPRYELQPFAAGQLTEFAERWFTELRPRFTRLRLPEPRQAAGDFVAALDRARLTDPARTPLMATMLCQLFAANPDRALPAGRSGAYKEFVDLLRQRQYEDSTGGIYAQMQTLLGPYGPAATTPASEVLVSAMDLIARLAFHRQQSGDDGVLVGSRQEGGNERAVNLLAEWTEARRPRHVPEQKWRSFVREILRRSGLLTQRAGDFQFIHQTVGEFLAAQHVMTDAHLKSAAHYELFGRWQPGTSWTPPPWDESYSRFLVAAWPDKDGLAVLLRRLATEGGLPGCRFIASLIADSALPDPAIAEMVAATLVAIAGGAAVEFPTRRDACEVLAQLQDPRGPDLLASLAASNDVSPASRRQAAESLARLGDSRGADLLAEQASRSEPDAVARRWAAESLARLGDPRGADLLLNIATDPATGDVDRNEAVRSLIRLSDNRRADQLAALLSSHLLDQLSVRHDAVLAFSRLADHRHADLLAALATASKANPAQHAAVARAFLRIGDYRGADMLAIVAAGGPSKKTIDTSVRLSAAETLAAIKDSRAQWNLARLAADTGIASLIRRRAASSLAQLSAADLLLDLAATSPGQLDTRLGATEALAWISDSRHLQALAYLVADPTVGAADRLRAGRALVRAGDRRVPDSLAALAAEPELDMSKRSEAAWLVVEAKGHRAALLRQILFSADSSQRRRATTALARLPGDQAVLLLEALTVARQAETDRDPFEVLARVIARLISEQDQPTGREIERFLEWLDSSESAGLYKWRWLSSASVKLSYAGANWEYDRRAKPALNSEVALAFRSRSMQEFAALLASGSFDEFPRLRAAEALASLGDPRGADILVAVAGHNMTAVHARVAATEALERLGDPRTAELLMAIVRDRALDPADRVKAALALVLVDAQAAISWLARLATDRSLADDDRGIAAGALTRFAAAGTEEALAAVAADNGLELPTRISAAQALSGLDNARAAALLSSLADDPGPVAVAHLEAAEALAQIDPARAATVLADLAFDHRLDSDPRARAAEALARLADPSTADELAVLAADSALPVYTRIEVAKALAGLADPRAASLLAAVADDPAHDPYARKWATDALRNLGQADPGRGPASQDG